MYTRWVRQAWCYHIIPAVYVIHDLDGTALALSWWHWTLEIVLYEPINTDDHGDIQP